jgi:hypothetical protein
MTEKTAEILRNEYSGTSTVEQSTVDSTWTVLRKYVNKYKYKTEPTFRELWTQWWPTNERVVYSIRVN